MFVENNLVLIHSWSVCQVYYSIFVVSVFGHNESCSFESLHFHLVFFLQDKLLSEISFYKLIGLKDSI